jgi:hypothetical protein
VQRSGQPPIRAAERNRRTWAASATGSTASRPWLIASLRSSCIRVSASAACVAPAPLAFWRGIGDGLQLTQGVGATQLVIKGRVGVIRCPGVADGDPDEGAKDTHRLHRLGAALGVDHEQGVLSRAGAVHPLRGP